MKNSIMNIKKAYFAAGCFWGVEYYFKQYKGVLSAVSGYMGGKIINPTYKEVCSGATGHLETVEVEYDCEVTNFKKLVELFFQIHDFTQTNGQGPDIGSQYLSAVFYENEYEKSVILEIIQLLRSKNYSVATKVVLLNNIPFYRAEEYHQDYYFKNKKLPYCHKYTQVF